MKWIRTLVFLSVFLAACASASSTDHPRCAGGVCIKIEIAEPLQSNQPFTATLTVTSDKDVSKMPVTMSSDAPDMLIEGPQGWQTRSLEWQMDVAANQPASVTRRLRLPREGDFGVYGFAMSPGGQIVDIARAQVTQAGGKIYQPGEVPTRRIPPPHGHPRNAGRPHVGTGATSEWRWSNADIDPAAGPNADHPDRAAPSCSAHHGDAASVNTYSGHSVLPVAGDRQ